MGAWIETRSLNRLKVLPKSHPVWVRGLKHSSKGGRVKRSSVAPRVGAWIETETREESTPPSEVAPRVGAWIETIGGGKFFLVEKSHPVWVRGLKLPRRRL